MKVISIAVAAAVAALLFGCVPPPNDRGFSPRVEYYGSGYDGRYVDDYAYRRARDQRDWRKGQWAERRERERREREWAKQREHERHEREWVQRREHERRERREPTRRPAPPRDERPRQVARPAPAVRPQPVERPPRGDHRAPDGEVPRIYRRQPGEPDRPY